MENEALSGEYANINKLHGRMINLSELGRFKKRLSRNYYLDEVIDPALRKKVSLQIKYRKDGLLFMPIDVADDINMQDAPYTKATYRLFIFGILEDGRRATVRLDGIAPYIEVQVPADKNAQDFAAELNDVLNNLDAESFSAATGKKAGEYYSIATGKAAGVEAEVEVVQGRYFKLFAEHPQEFVRISFGKLAARRYAIQYLCAVGHRVVHDDLNNYYRVVCRDYQLSFNVWCTLTGFSQIDDERVRGLAFALNVANYKPCAPEFIQAHEHLQKDPCLSMCWDCETYKPYRAEDRGVPTHENPDHILFMIGTTFQWYHAAGNSQLLRVCYVDKPSLPHPDYFTIVCGDEKGVISAFVEVWTLMLPDLILGFNDGEYDWPWLKARAETHGLLKKLARGVAQVWPSDYGSNPWTNSAITAKYYKSSQYKLEADTSITCYKFDFPGCVAIDVRTVFRQLFPNDEASSLNHYLTRLDIPTKLDVNFKDMFDMYAAMLECERAGDAIPDSLLTTMQQVAHYCIIDAQRCHELMSKLYVIMDKRAISHMSYVSFQDAIERANGMKVRNLIIAAGQLSPFNLKFSNNAVELADDGERAKYPGAYVFPPIKGLVNGKLSLDELAALGQITQEEAVVAKEIVAKHGAVLTREQLAAIGCGRGEPTGRGEPIGCGKSNQLSGNSGDEIGSRVKTGADPPVLSRAVTDFFLEEIKRPITGLDFNSLYPSLMMTYNLSPEYMILDKQVAMELSARHTLFRIKFPFEGKPVNGWIVRHDNKIDPASADFKFGIFGYVLKQLFDKRKALKAQMKQWEKLAEEAKEDSAEYAHAKFQFEYMNSTQKALKIFMNTFYGEIGNQRSPFFMVQVAGGVTVNGGRNVRMAQQFVEQKGCKVYYGDTDSIYTSMPDVHFLDVDKEYYSGKITKEDYWARLVEITLEVIAVVRNEVNEYFHFDNGTRFLTMAFEEVLFPVFFASKKKYVGIAHEHRPSFAAPLNLADLSQKYAKELVLKNKELMADNAQLQNAIDNAIIAKRKKQFFIRGLDVVKRGMPNFAKEIVLDILEEMVAINNVREVADIVRDKVRDIYSRKWNDPALMYKFVMTDQFKPHKKNQKMHVFVGRMAQEHRVEIRPFERVRYIIAAKYPYKYDICGRQVELSTGEKMELADVAAEKKFTIDIDEYMRSRVHGQLGRLVAYKSDFLPANHAAVNMADDEEVKAMEDAIYSAASKWVVGICAEYTCKYGKLGPIYQTVSKAAAEIARHNIGHDKMSKRLLIPKTAEELDELPEWISKKAQSVARAETKSFGKKIVKDAVAKIREYLVEHGVECADLVQAGDRRGGYKSLNQYIYTRMLESYRRLLPSTRRICDANGRAIMLDIRDNLDSIRQIYMQFNEAVSANAAELLNGCNLEELYRAGTRKGTILRTQADLLQKIEAYGASDPASVASGFAASVASGFAASATSATRIYLSIFNRLCANYIAMFKIESICAELEAIKDRQVGHISVQVDGGKIIAMVDEIIATL
jgi:DNA polymerase elongation subunit (family B)